MFDCRKLPSYLKCQQKASWCQSLRITEEKDYFFATQYSFTNIQPGENECIHHRREANLSTDRSFNRPECSAATIWGSDATLLFPTGEPYSQTSDYSSPLILTARENNRWMQHTRSGDRGRHFGKSLTAGGNR